MSKLISQSRPKKRTSKTQAMLCLSGDIGASNSRLALLDVNVDVSVAPLKWVGKQTFKKFGIFELQGCAKIFSKGASHLL